MGEELYILQNNHAVNNAHMSYTLTREGKIKWYDKEFDNDTELQSHFTELELMFEKVVSFNGAGLFNNMSDILRAWNKIEE